ncbi:hypothetical protein KXV45_007066 [Aspergillus fumigatus]|nr:hypothetical protein KXV45_007066 [Aspergillus fumigatus]
MKARSHRLELDLLAPPGTGGNVTSPEYSTALNSDVMQNAESDRAMSKEEADRMYEQRMEEEYAKREGGA